MKQVLRAGALGRPRGMGWGGRREGMQGNLDFFLIRASQGPFHLKHKTQGPSHIHIPNGKLLLRCLWIDGLPLHSKTGNQLSSPDDMCKVISLQLIKINEKKEEEEGDI